MCCRRGINDFQLFWSQSWRPLSASKASSLSFRLFQFLPCSCLHAVVFSRTLMCWYSFSSSCNTSSCFRTDSCWNSPRSTCTQIKYSIVRVSKILPLRAKTFLRHRVFNFIIRYQSDMFLLHSGLAGIIDNICGNVFHSKIQICKVSKLIFLH